MITCLCDAFYPKTALAAANILEFFGYRVNFNESQTCCGQPAYNTGDWINARKVARHTLILFKDTPLVVTPSGSCAAMIRAGFPELFRGEPEENDAIQLARRTWDLTEILLQKTETSPWPGSLNARIQLHQSCHLRELGIWEKIPGFLAEIEGLKILPLAQQEQCCGFGGTFSVTHPHTSRDIGLSKWKHLLKGKPDFIVTTDRGCGMHLEGLSKKQKSLAGRKLPSLISIAELLWMSLENEKAEATR